MTQALGRTTEGAVNLLLQRFRDQSDAVGYGIEGAKIISFCGVAVHTGCQDI